MKKPVNNLKPKPLAQQSKHTKSKESLVNLNNDTETMPQLNRSTVSGGRRIKFTRKQSKPDFTKTQGQQQLLNQYQQKSRQQSQSKSNFNHNNVKLNAATKDTANINNKNFTDFVFNNGVKNNMFTSESSLVMDIPQINMIKQKRIRRKPTVEQGGRVSSRGTNNDEEDFLFGAKIISQKDLLNDFKDPHSPIEQLKNKNHNFNSNYKHQDLQKLPQATQLNNRNSVGKNCLSPPQRPTPNNDIINYDVTHTPLVRHKFRLNRNIQSTSETQSRAMVLNINSMNINKDTLSKNQNGDSNHQYQNRYATQQFLSQNPSEALAPLTERQTNQYSVCNKSSVRLKNILNSNYGSSDDFEENPQDQDGRQELLLLEIKHLKRENTFLKKKIKDLNKELCGPGSFPSERKKSTASLLIDGENGKGADPQQKQNQPIFTLKYKGSPKQNLDSMHLSINIFFQQIKNLLNSMTRLFKIDFSQQEIRKFSSMHSAQQMKLQITSEEACPIKRHHVLKKFYLKKKLQKVGLIEQGQRFNMMMDIFTDYYQQKEESQAAIANCVDNMIMYASDLNKWLLENAAQKKLNKQSQFDCGGSSYFQGETTSRVMSSFDENYKNKKYQDNDDSRNNNNDEPKKTKKQKKTTAGNSELQELNVRSPTLAQTSLPLSPISSAMNNFRSNEGKYNYVCPAPIISRVNKLSNVTKG